MCCHSCLELGLRLTTKRVGSTAPPRKAHSAADWIHVRHRLDSTEGSSSLPAPAAQVKKEASSKEEGKRPRKKKYASIFYKPVPEEKELAELLDKGKKKGKLSSGELMDVLEEMDLESEQLDKIYDTMENMGIDTAGEDYLPELVDEVPPIEEIEEIPEEEYLTPIGKAKVKREGKDLTIITWSREVHFALEAAQTLEAEGIDVEVLDLRTLVPLDWDAIVKSVSKTHNVIIVSEEVKRGSYAGELSAQIAEELFDELDAPVERVCGLNICSPFSPVLEDKNFPHPEDIVRAVKRVLNK